MKSAVLLILCIYLNISGFILATGKAVKLYMWFFKTCENKVL